jgi:hypothetical protein
MLSQDLQPSLAILALIEGEWTARMIQLVTRLRIPNLLEAGPKSIGELAQITEMHERTLYRIIRALASQDIFQLTDGDVVRQTSLSAALVMQQNSIAPMVAMFGDEWLRKMWDGLEQSMKTGQPGFNTVHDGLSIFAYCNQHPEALQSFQAGMTSFSSMVNEPIAQSYDFGTFETLVDLGGGHGSLLTTILNAHPVKEGILFDLPSVVEQVQIDSELQDRMRTFGGTFFEGVPPADSYIMKQVLHDWDDNVCISILQQCRASLHPGGKILVADRVISDEEPFSAFNKIWDVLMSTVVGGQERTREDFNRIFNAAGLHLTRVISTGTPISLIEGSPD